MSSYPITYPVTRAVTYPPARALLGKAGTTPAPPAFTPSLDFSDARNSQYAAIA